MSKQSEYRVRQDNGAEDLRRELSVEEGDLAANVGHLAVYHRPGVEPREVIVTGVQKVWDDDEDGNYRLGVEGYTVRRAADEWIDEETRAYPLYAASVREIVFLD